MDTIFTLVTGLLVGLVLGSFTTMLSYRLPRGLSIVMPPSQCPSCGHRLTPRDLVPVFSWLFNRGRCRHCGKKIGVRYLLIELVTTLAVTVAFLLIGLSWLIVPALLAIIALVAFGTIQMEKK